MTTTQPDQSLSPGKIGGLQTHKPSEVSTTFNMLVYGDSGAGKTQLIGSASEVEALSPVLLLDIEGGSSTLKGMYESVEVLPVRSWKTLQPIYNDLHAGKHHYKTVAIDSLSEAQVLGLALITQEPTSKIDLIDNPEIGIKQRGDNVAQVRKLVRAFRDLNVNTIFTSLSMTREEQHNISTKWPLFSEKLADQIPGLFDLVLYLSQNEGKVTLHTRRTKKILAKSRDHNLPNTIDDPTIKKIINAKG